MFQAVDDDWRNRTLSGTVYAGGTAIHLLRSSREGIGFGGGPRPPPPPPPPPTPAPPRSDRGVFEGDLFCGGGGDKNGSLSLFDDRPHGGATVVKGSFGVFLLCVCQKEANKRSPRRRVPHWKNTPAVNESVESRGNSRAKGVTHSVRGSRFAGAGGLRRRRRRRRTDERTDGGRRSTEDGRRKRRRERERETETERPHWLLGVALQTMKGVGRAALVSSGGAAAVPPRRCCRRRRWRANSARINTHTHTHTHTHAHTQDQTLTD